MPRIGQPVELAQAATEDKSDRDAADDGAGQEQPQRLGEQCRFQHGQAYEQQRQPRAHAVAARQPGGDRLADRGDDEDEE